MNRSLLLIAAARPFALAHPTIARQIREAFGMSIDDRISADTGTSIESRGQDRTYETVAWRGADSSEVLDRKRERSASSSDGTLAAAYQSAAFFDYLRDAEKDSRFEILTVVDPRKAVVGAVPIKLSTLHLPFSIGARKLAGSRLKSRQHRGQRTDDRRRPRVAG